MAGRIAVLISRVSSKGQVTLPKKVREAIGVGPGDTVAYDVAKGVVTLCRLEPIDLAFHAAVESTLAVLARPSLVRLKLFTLDNRFIVRQLGTLAARDRGAVAGGVRDHLPLLSADVS